MTAIVIATTLFGMTTSAFAHPRVTGITAAGAKIRASVRKSDPCLSQIIDRETGGTWDPRISNGYAHWHPGDPPSRRSYGLPQAQPGEKMASTGQDWRTNPLTQLRWAKRYAISRYGSTCAALSFWLRHRWW